MDPKNRLMEMRSKNMSFCNVVNMEEKMTYTPDPEDPNRTLMKQETVVTVQGVPLTSYMEGIIVNTVSSNSSKGRAAIEWIVEKLGNECRFNIFSSTFSYWPSPAFSPGLLEPETLNDLSLNPLDICVVPFLFNKSGHVIL